MMFIILLTRILEEIKAGQTNRKAHYIMRIHVFDTQFRFLPTLGLDGDTDDHELQRWNQAKYLEKCIQYIFY